MRFFLDSNVLVSGIVFSGKEQLILLMSFRGEHELVVSEDVLRETLDALRKKFPRFRQEAEETLSVLRLETVPRKAYARQSREFTGLRDPSDAHVLAAALVARCDLIVTGDRDLLLLGDVEGVKIIRPRQALSLMAASR